MDGGTGNDSMNGLAGNDIMFGDTGVDSMFGGTGNDIMFGGTGMDTLSGGTGSDVLHGGTDSDVFRWSLGETGNDFISDFELVSSGDALDLKDLLTGESADAASLDTYLNFSANAAGKTLITVDANGPADAGGTGQTITLDNIIFTDLQASASYTGSAGSASDIAILTKLLRDSNLLTTP
jgi:Ca2+-binding RTX toxin-like protein